MGFVALLVVLDHLPWALFSTANILFSVCNSNRSVS